jgi:hypothetical protein
MKMKSEDSMQKQKGGSMKKTAAALVFLTFMAVWFSCGGDKGAARKEIAPAAGKAYDCKYFTMTVAEGWEAGPLTFGMVNVLPRGKVSPGLYFKFEGDGNSAGTAEASIAAMIKNYNGTPMAERSIAGTVFKTTTYNYSGMTKITITIEGANAGNDPGIQSMLASVVLK